MLGRLREDPGTRTLGQLLQERQWALQEIERLTDEVLCLKSLPVGKGSTHEVISETEAARRAQALRNPQRLIRMKELRQMLGLGHSTIYKMMGEGRFPRSVHLGERTTAWRLADVEAWQAGLK
jgi:prophage regulatory protein